MLIINLMNIINLIGVIILEFTKFNLIIIFFNAEIKIIEKTICINRNQKLFEKHGISF